MFFQSTAVGVPNRIQRGVEGARRSGRGRSGTTACRAYRSRPAAPSQYWRNVYGPCLAAEAQKAGRIPRLCFLTFDPGTPQSSRFSPFFQGLRDLGCVDGQTISIDYLSADGRGDRFPTLAADCLRLKADIIVVTTTPAAQAAKSVTRRIPIVTTALGDPVGTGLVASFARPGGNVTGMTSMASLGLLPSGSSC
jgi:hypothetical protein